MQREYYLFSKSLSSPWELSFPLPFSSLPLESLLEMAACFSGGAVMETAGTGLEELSAKNHNKNNHKPHNYINKQDNLLLSDYG